ncbi:hypothetical protein Ancab_021877 [Ancistrocladus abbreviatus]
MGRCFISQVSEHSTTSSPTGQTPWYKFFVQRVLYLHHKILSESVLFESFPVYPICQWQQREVLLHTDQVMDLALGNWLARMKYNCELIQCIGDLDDEIMGLRKQVRQLRNVAQEIESEAKFQNDFMNQLQMTLIKVQAGVKNNVRRLNKSVVQSGSSHILHVVLFALFCLFLVVLWSKISRR